MTIETMAISDNQNNVLIKMRILESAINFHIDIKKIISKDKKYNLAFFQICFILYKTIMLFKRPYLSRTIIRYFYTLVVFVRNTVFYLHTSLIIIVYLSR